MIISGGGTGGHVFPAIAIANLFRERHPDSNILFVGAKGRMEMTRVPEAGYPIIGMWISGLQRKLTLSNALFPVKVLVSYLKALRLLRSFKPHVVVGTGGYASGPVMMAAVNRRIPSLIQEQNSFAGLVNRRVAGKVDAVCVAYEGMEKYFPADKIKLTGNPVRTDILNLEGKRERALERFGFSHHHKTLVVIGGSGGARTINDSLLHGISKIIDAGIQMLWVTGKTYYPKYHEALSAYDAKRIWVLDFIGEVDLAYAMADVVVSRSGALAISELSATGKASVLVPSPNVTDDHQTKNALALTERRAAVMVSDAHAEEKLVDEVLSLIFDERKCATLSNNIKRFARPHATEDIVTEIEQLIA